MNHTGTLDETVCAILTEFKRIAVVGLSDRPWRDSNRVSAYMLGHGYDVAPVNPEISESLGLISYPDLFALPPPVEIVNIFRRPEYIPDIVDEAIVAGAKAVWMQRGLIDEESAARARAAGLMVVMDRCIMVEHSRHLGVDQGPTRKASSVQTSRNSSCRST